MSEFNAHSICRWAACNLLRLLQQSLVSLRVPLDQKRRFEDHFVAANEFSRHLQSITKDISAHELECTAMICSILEIQDYVLPVSREFVQASKAGWQESENEKLNWLVFFRQEVSADGAAIRKWAQNVRKLAKSADLGGKFD